MMAVALAACGGGDNDGPGQDLRFKARAQARESTATAPAAMAPLTAAERAEVQRRSREWASGSLLGTPATSNGVTLPPLYFGLAFTLEAAAQGDTLLQLRSALPATSGPAVSAALQQGLQRTLRAGENTILVPPFFNAVTGADQPGTFSTLTLQPLTAAELQREPNLRVAVSDQASALWRWPQVTPYRATWAAPNGGLLDVAMLRTQGPTRSVAGSGWTGRAMALGDGQWLLLVEPSGALSSWTAADLNTALAAATDSLQQPAAAAAAEATWELPAKAVSSSTELNDRRGMALAQDPVHANLRGLDGGGTYASPSGGQASVQLSASGVGYSGTQRVEFIFSPYNLHGPGFSGGSVSTLIRPPPPCPSATVNLRPFFMAWLQPSGNLALLSRMSSFSGTACSNSPGFIIIPPG